MRTLGCLIRTALTRTWGFCCRINALPTVKVATFFDDGRNVFTERCGYVGSILKQLADAYAFLKAHNTIEPSSRALSGLIGVITSQLRLGRLL